MNAVLFQEKLQNFLAQPNFTDTMKSNKLVEQRSIVVGSSQFSDKLTYGFGHGLFVANGYPPLGMMFPNRFPEGRNAEGNLRLTQANGYLLLPQDETIVPRLLWNDQEVLNKVFVQKALDATICFSVSGMDFYLLTLKTGEKIIGTGNWAYNGFAKKTCFILADADNCLLHFIKPENIKTAKRIEFDNEGAASDYSHYLVSQDGSELIRDEYLPAKGGAGIFIS